MSSFGFGGTNAHVILEEAPPVAPTADAPAPPAALLVLSAHTPTALAAQARQLAAHWPDAPLADIAYTAAVGRAALPQRLALVAAQAPTRSERWRPSPATVRPRRSSPVRRSETAPWRCSSAGQGGASRARAAPWRQHSPTFRALLSETLAAAAAYWPHDLRRVLWDDDDAWHRVDAQPALVVLQIALGRYWRAVGLEPRLLLGHSLGEYAAACLAGVLTLSDTLRLVSPAQLLREHCSRPHAGRLGAEAECDRCWSRRWTPSAGGQQVTYQRPQWPYVSSLTGTWAQDEVASADYWCRHLRHTVRFHDALQCARAAAPAVYLEVGAGSTLAALVRSTLRDAAPCVLPGLRGDDREWTEHLTTLGQLFVRGTPLRWPEVWGAPRRKVTLPSYPFQRQRYWFAAAAPVTVRRSRAAGSRAAGSLVPGPVVPGPVVHPLLGRRLDLAGHEIIYETDLRSVAYLADHRLDGVAVFPTTGYLELALAAGREAGFKLLDVRELKIRRPLTLGADQSGRVQVVLTPDGSGLACRIRRARRASGTRTPPVAWRRSRWRTPRGRGSRRKVRPGRWPPTTPAAGSGAWTTGRRFKVCGNSRARPVKPGAWWPCPRRWTPTATWSIPPCSTPACKSPPLPSPTNPPTPGSRYACGAIGCYKPMNRSHSCMFTPLRISRRMATVFL